MKTNLITLLATLALSLTAFAHNDIEIGPNGGRVLEFSKDESMHGEVTLKDGKFHIALLDKDMKPVALAEQTLTVNGGPTGKAEKLTVEKAGNQFVVPAVKPGEWLIVQFKEKAGAKAVTARIQYDTAECSKCDNQEWLCKCAHGAEKK